MLPCMLATTRPHSPVGASRPVLPAVLALLPTTTLAVVAALLLPPVWCSRRRARVHRDGPPHPVCLGPSWPHGVWWGVWRHHHHAGPHLSHGQLAPTTLTRGRRNHHAATHTRTCSSSSRTFITGSPPAAATGCSRAQCVTHRQLQQCIQFCDISNHAQASDSSCAAAPIIGGPGGGCPGGPGIIGGISCRLPSGPIVAIWWGTMPGASGMLRTGGWGGGWEPVCALAVRGGGGEAAHACGEARQRGAVWRKLRQPQKGREPASLQQGCVCTHLPPCAPCPQDVVGPWVWHHRVVGAVGRRRRGAPAGPAWAQATHLQHTAGAGT